MIETRFHAAIDELPAAAWDALRTQANPFVSHSLLLALEQTGCIRADWGWQPYHLGLYERGALIAASPLYLKGNSHGEFVFDWSWASAWERAGGEYYPKLLNAIPYSPVPGPRLLAGNGSATAILQRALVEAMRDEVDRLQLSSLHANFLEEGELAAFDDDWLTRSDVQFHWHNRGYADFAGFLAALNHKKRKNIVRERAQVARSGLTLELRRGDSLHRADWRQIHALYAATFDAKGNHAALTPAFFSRLGEGSLGIATQVALARRDEVIVAMALFLQSHDTLYGRYWGARDDLAGLYLPQQDLAAAVPDSSKESSNVLSFLHFELCYYQGIEHCIRHGLKSFEPGAQGQHHKMARGFLPTLTHSRHYIAHQGFRQAVHEALKDEQQNRDADMQAMMEHSPYAHRQAQDEV